MLPGNSAAGGSEEKINRENGKRGDWHPVYKSALDSSRVNHKTNNRHDADYVHKKCCTLFHDNSPSLLV